MMIVADASPLVFLGKLGQLKLIPAVLGRVILVPTAVRDEILADPISPAEARSLNTFLAGCDVVTVPRPEHFARGLSRADDEALTLAVRRHADWLLTDERLLRDMAEIEHVRPIGTLGVLLRAMQADRLTPAITRHCVEALVREHRFRIGIALYENVLRTIAGG